MHIIEFLSCYFRLGKEKQHSQRRQAKGTNIQNKFINRFQSLPYRVKLNCRMISNPEIRMSKPIAMPHSLPPKPSELTVCRTAKGKLQNSMINELTLLQNSSPIDININLTPQAQQYLQIRNSQSSQKQRIDLSLSSDCLDTEYQYGYLRKKVEDLTGKLAMMVQEQCSANGQVEFYKRKVEQYLERNKQLEKTVNELRQQITQCGQKIRQEQQKICEMDRKCQLQRKEFSNAKEVGQRQIDELLQKLRESERQIAILKQSVIESKTIESISCSSPNPINKQQPYYMKRFLQFTKKLDEKMDINNDKGLLFGGISAKSYVGLTLSETINHATTEKDQRISKLQEQNYRLMNLIQHSCDITRSLQACKINFFPD